MDDNAAEINAVTKLEQRCREHALNMAKEVIPFDNAMAEASIYWKVLLTACLHHQCQPQDLATRPMTDEDRVCIYDFCHRVAEGVIADNPHPVLKQKSIREKVIGQMATYMLMIYERLGLEAVDIYRLYGDGQSDEVMTPN